MLHCSFPKGIRPLFGVGQYAAYTCRWRRSGAVGYVGDNVSQAVEVEEWKRVRSVSQVLEVEQWKRVRVVLQVVEVGERER